jgi:hypothetical protein
MARRRARARSSRQDAKVVGTTGRNGLVSGGLEASVIPRVLVGTVNGVEIVAVGALQFARDVLLSAVSGAANIGAEALTATTAGARGVVSATSQMIGDIAGTAEGAFRDVLNNARHARPGGARVTLRRRTADIAGGENETPTAAAPRRRRQSSRQRPAGRPARPSVAA